MPSTPLCENVLRAPGRRAPASISQPFSHAAHAHAQARLGLGTRRRNDTRGPEVRSAFHRFERITGWELQVTVKTLSLWLRMVFQRGLGANEEHMDRWVSEDQPVTVDLCFWGSVTTLLQEFQRRAPGLDVEVFIAAISMIEFGRGAKDAFGVNSNNPLSGLNLQGSCFTNFVVDSHPSYVSVRDQDSVALSNVQLATQSTNATIRLA
jgi:hypothetical protein